MTPLSSSTQTTRPAAFGFLQCSLRLRWWRTSSRSVKEVARELDGFVGRQRPALLPCLGECGFVELGADPVERRFVHPRNPMRAGADLGQSLGTGEEPGGDPRPSHGHEDAGEAGDADRDPEEIAEVDVDAVGLLQHRNGVPSPALVESDTRQLLQRQRLDELVAKRTRPPEVLLVQRPGAFEIAELPVRRREAASRRPGVGLVAEVAEEPEALLEELLRP